jgi:hypothetical protein
MQVLLLLGASSSGVNDAYHNAGCRASDARRGGGNFRYFEQKESTRYEENIRQQFIMLAEKTRKWLSVSLHDRDCEMGSKTVRRDVCKQTTDAYKHAS